MTARQLHAAAVDLFGTDHPFPRHLQRVQDDAEKLVALCRACHEESASCSTVRATSEAWRLFHPSAIKSRAACDDARPLWAALWADRSARDHVSCDCPAGLYCALRESRRSRWQFAAWKADQPTRKDDNR